MRTVQVTNKFLDAVQEAVDKQEGIFSDLAFAVTSLRICGDLGSYLDCYADAPIYVLPEGTVIP